MAHLVQQAHQAKGETKVNKEIRDHLASREKLEGKETLVHLDTLETL